MASTGNPPNGSGSTPPVVNVANGTESIMPNAMPPRAIQFGQFDKPEKFKGGSNFKLWKEKIMFYLTTLNLVRFVTEDKPVENEADPQSVAAIKDWSHGDYMCRHSILMSLDDSLYQIFYEKSSAKDLWESLTKKYTVDDAGAKKFIAARFHEFKMVDGRSVLEQSEELQRIYYDLAAEGMIINEPLQVALMIEKLPPSWDDFKHYLKHKKKEMTLEDLILKLRIEQDVRKSKRAYNSISEAHVVEACEGSRAGA